MRTHLRKLMEKNDGMTLVEVIVAFAILTIAMVILLYGMTMAIKVMGNAESIKNAEENNASSLDLEKELTDSGTRLVQIPSTGTEQWQLMGNPQLIMKGVFKKATTSKLNQPGDSLSLYLFTAQQKTQLRPQPVVKTSGPVDERSEWDPYVPKEGQLSVAINKVQANGGIESKYKDTERMVVTDTQTISGKINGAQQTKQLFFAGSPAIRFESDDASLKHYQSNLYYFGGDIIARSRTNENKINHLYLKKLESQEGILLFFNQETTISIQDSGTSNTRSRVIQRGYYYIKKNDAYDLLQIVTSDEEYNKFNQTFSSASGYYLDYKSTDDLQVLKSLLKERGIMLVNLDDDNAWIDPKTKE